MKKNSAVALALITTFLVPALVSAQGTQTITSGFASVGTVVKSFNDTIVRGLVTLFASLAMVAFFWGLVQYIWGARKGEGEQIKKGNTFMAWSLVALFVMFSVWGIIRLFQGVLFGQQDINTIIIPDLQIQNGGGSSQGGNSTCSVIRDQQTCLLMNCAWSGSSCR